MATEVVCPVGSFGERLQREREMRGITLEEIAEATKIGTRSLRALEEQEFDKLPGGIFNKGFVRAYSRYLGIDEEQAVADYVAALTEAQAAGRATRPEPSVSLPAETEISNLEHQDRMARLVAWVPLVVLAIVLVAAFAGWRYIARHGFPRLRSAQAANIQPRNHVPSVQVRTQPQPPLTEATPVPAASAATTASSASPQVSPAKPADAAPPAAVDGFVLRVHAKEDSWVLVIADGKQVIAGVLAAATEKAVRAQKTIVLKTGNAGGLELFRNEQPLPQLGPENQVRQVTITATQVQR